MGWMTLIADLHGRTPTVRPDSYLVLLAGDICPDAGQSEWWNGPFRRWLDSLPCPCIAVPGNHDKLLETPCPWRGIGPANFTLLGPGQLVHKAGVFILGQPYVLDGGAFRGTEEDIERAVSRMPERCDVLLSHNPPLGVLDTPSVAGHPGSLTLRYACWKKRPKLCVFGHVHEARGYRQDGSTYYVNATLGAGCAGTGLPIAARFEPWGLADNSWRRD